MRRRSSKPRSASELAREGAMVYDDRCRIEPTPQKKHVKMRDIRLSVLPPVIESLGRSRKVMENAGKCSG